MNNSTETVGDKLGITARHSMLLEKARNLGLTHPAQFESLAVARGCWHYRQPEMPDLPTVSESQFSDEELAIALLSPSQPYSPHTIRLGAAMLGAIGNSAETIVTLAFEERAAIAVHYIAKAATQFEPENSFWRDLLQRLPIVAEPTEGVFPHPTRFVSMTGFTRRGPEKIVVWIRPRADLSLAHG